MIRPVRKRFWLEAASALTTAVLAVATLISREWIEIVFRVDPDGGSGLVEWAAVVVSLTLTVVLFGLARYEWRRAVGAAA